MRKEERMKADERRRYEDLCGTGAGDMNKCGAPEQEIQWLWRRPLGETEEVSMSGMSEQRGGDCGGYGP